MTQEEKAKDWIESCGEKYGVHAQAAAQTIYDLLTEQPIPQDIEKWIESEASKERTDLEVVCSKRAAKAIYQLLLPELQRLRDENEVNQSEAHKWWTQAMKLKEEIEQQKSQIEEAKGYQQAAEIQSLKEALKAETECTDHIKEVLR